MTLYIGLFGHLMLPIQECLHGILYLTLYSNHNLNICCLKGFEGPGAAISRQDRLGILLSDML